MSSPRSLGFVAGAFPRSPHGRDNSADRKSRRRTTNYSYRGASDHITGPPQHTQTHEHRHYEEHYRGQHHGACDPCAHPSPPLAAYASEMSQTLFAAERLSVSDRSAAISLYYSCAKASRNFCSCSSGRLVEMISKSYCFNSSTTLSGAVAPLVSANRAEVPSVTFSRTCLMKSSSMPTSDIAPVIPPIAAPRKGTKKIIPIRNPQNAPQPALPPCNSRVLGFLLPWGQLTTAASSRVINSRSCMPCRATMTLSAP